MYILETKDGHRILKDKEAHGATIHLRIKNIVDSLQACDDGTLKWLEMEAPGEPETRRYVFLGTFPVRVYKEE